MVLMAKKVFVKFMSLMEMADVRLDQHQFLNMVLRDKKAIAVRVQIRPLVKITTEHFQ